MVLFIFLRFQRLVNKNELNRSGIARLSGHEGIAHICVNIIDKTNSLNPTDQESFWTFKFDTLISKRLNLRDFI